MTGGSVNLATEMRRVAVDEGATDDLGAAARRALVIHAGGSEPVEWVWGRAVRLRRLVQRLVELDEVRLLRYDRRAVEAAALFVDSAWAEELRAGRVRRDAVMLQPMDMRQRELSADVLIRETADVLPDETRRIAGRAIREAGARGTTLTEAIVLGEAVELESIGPEWALLESRRAWVRGQDSATLVGQWRTQQRYGYWEGRIRDRLRYEWSRRAARQRLAGLAAFMETFAAQVAVET